MAALLLGCLCWVQGCVLTLGITRDGEPDQALRDELADTGRNVGAIAGAATGLPFGAQVGGLLGEWGGWAIAGLFGVGTVRKNKQAADADADRRVAEAVSKERDAAWDAAEAYTLARLGGLGRGVPVSAAATPPEVNP